MKVFFWLIVISVIILITKKYKRGNFKNPKPFSQEIVLIPQENSLNVNDFTENIPHRTKSLLYISEDDPSNASFSNAIKITINFADHVIESERMPSTDPSTIFLKAPITKPRKNELIEKIGYYPTYLHLTPEQKWIYIKWLHDVTKEIDIGYVFVYYYGLERQLLLDNFDDAFDEILVLREYHRNNSFLWYSGGALFYSCILKGRNDKLNDLKSLLNQGIWNNLHLLLAYKLELDLSVDNIIAIVKGPNELNKRYVKNYLDMYKSVLKEILIKKYSKSELPFSGNYEYKDFPKSENLTYANTSFPNEIRTIKVPNLIDYGPFINEISSLHREVHEVMKVNLREMRKN